MLSPEYDLLYLRAGLEELKPFLLSKELYWSLGLRPVAGYPPYPRLTVGNLLLPLARLQARREYGDYDHIEVEYLKLIENLEDIKQKWRTAWDGKAQREITSRYGQWKRKISDMRADNSSSPGHYRGAIRERVLLDLLAAELGEYAPAEMGMLAKLDSRLRAMTADTDFLWDKDLEPGFPQNLFWYLYRLPK